MGTLRGLMLLELILAWSRMTVFNIFSVLCKTCFRAAAVGIASNMLLLFILLWSLRFVFILVHFARHLLFVKAQHAWDFTSSRMTFFARTCFLSDSIVATVCLLS